MLQLYHRNVISIMQGEGNCWTIQFLEQKLNQKREMEREHTDLKETYQPIIACEPCQNPHSNNLEKTVHKHTHIYERIKNQNAAGYIMIIKKNCFLSAIMVLWHFYNLTQRYTEIIDEAL